MERIRVGSRQGLMWHGRERVAQAHYQKALDQWAAGDVDKALWHTTLALHCYPRMLPAVQFKERTHSTRDWDTESSLSRDFLFRFVARQNGYQPSPFERPAISAEPGLPPVDADEPAQVDQE